MARINIEDSIYRDKRFIKLIAKSGSLETALGILVRAWSVAQSWYLTKDRTIPVDEWKKQELSDLLFEVGLARVIDGKIRVSGADTQFEWLLQRSEAGKKGGPAAARSRRENIEKSGRRKSSDHVGSRPLTLTPSLTLPLSQAHSQKKELKTPTSSESPSSQFIGAYVKAFQARYGEKTRPHLGGKELGSIKRFLSTTPADRACAMIQVYLQMNDAWFQTKKHDLETFVQNATNVGLALDTGQGGGMAAWEREVLAQESKKNGTQRLSERDAKAEKLLRRETLPAGEGADLVEGGYGSASDMADEDG